MPLLRTTIGEVLRRIRLEQGRTLADVSRAARVSMPYLSEVERGRKEASSEVLAAICDALQVSLPDVLAGVVGEMAAVIRLAPAAAPAQAAPPGPARIIPLDPPGRQPAPAPGSGPANAKCLLAA
jgi:XRE family transcriptional regulator, stress-response regulator